jgi:hypothetical protein
MGCLRIAIRWITDQEAKTRIKYIFILNSAPIDILSHIGFVVSVDLIARQLLLIGHPKKTMEIK